MKQFRRVLCAFLLLCVATGVKAEAYVTDIILRAGDGTDPKTLEGWTNAGIDLNTGAGGWDIYLFYKTSETANPETGYITDLLCSTDPDLDSFTQDGRKYHKCPVYDTGFDGDLNHGVYESTDIYLFYTKDHANLPSTRHTMTSISVYAGDAEEGCVCWKDEDQFSGYVDANEWVYGSTDVRIKMNLTTQKLKFTTLPTITASFVYDGSAHNLISNTPASNAGTIKYRVNINNNWTDVSPTMPQATNAGEYPVECFVDGGSFAENSDTTSGTVIVSKAASTLITAPAQVKDAEAPDNNSLLYTGTARKLVSAGVAGGVTGTTNTTHGNKVQYKLDDGEWGDNVPEATEIGDYTIYYKVKGDANHKDLEDAAYKIENHIVMNAGVTAIRSAEILQRTVDSYYDLNGRKLNGMPTQKGVYIKSGRKVVK